MFVLEISVACVFVDDAHDAFDIEVLFLFCGVVRVVAERVERGGSGLCGCGLCGGGLRGVALSLALVSYLVVDVGE